MLLWDAAALVVPVLPGSYVAKGVKYLNKFDNVLDIANGLRKGKNTVKYIKNGENIVDGLKIFDKVNDTKNYLKSTKEVFQEVAQRAIKSGGDVIKDGRVLATNAKKAAEKSYNVVKKVNTKISNITEKIASSTKVITSKVQAYASTKIDDVAKGYNKGTTKAKEFLTNTVKPTVVKEYGYIKDAYKQTVKQTNTMLSSNLAGPLDKFVDNYSKIKKGVGKPNSKEIFLDTASSHDTARKTLIGELDSTGAFKNGSNPSQGRLKSSYGYGKQIGRQSLDGKVRWRLDFDEIIGVHYNIEDFSKGKGVNAVKKVIPIDISEQAYKKIIDLWNR